MNGNKKINNLKKVIVLISIAILIAVVFLVMTLYNNKFGSMFDKDDGTHGGRVTAKTTTTDIIFLEGDEEEISELINKIEEKSTDYNRDIVFILQGIGFTDEEINNIKDDKEKIVTEIVNKIDNQELSTDKLAEVVKSSEIDFSEPETTVAATTVQCDAPKTTTAKKTKKTTVATTQAYVPTTVTSTSPVTTVIHTTTKPAKNYTVLNYGAGSGIEGNRSSVEWGIFDAINSRRSQAGVPTLKMAKELRDKAENYATTARNGFEASIPAYMEDKEHNSLSCSPGTDLFNGGTYCSNSFCGNSCVAGKLIDQNPSVDFMDSKYEYVGVGLISNGTNFSAVIIVD